MSEDYTQRVTRRTVEQLMTAYGITGPLAEVVASTAAESCDDVECDPLSTAERMHSAVTAWLTERLGSAEVREAARRGVCYTGGDPSHRRETEMTIAEAVLAAVVEALAGEGR